MSEQRPEQSLQPGLEPGLEPGPEPRPDPSSEKGPSQIPGLPVSPAQPAASQPITEFHIGDEFGTAKRNFPPLGIVLICIAAVALILGIFAFKERPKPQGAGSIDFVAAAEVPGQNMVLAAITMTLRNTGRTPLWVHTL